MTIMKSDVTLHSTNIYLDVLVGMVFTHSWFAMSPLGWDFLWAVHESLCIIYCVWNYTYRFS